MKNIFPFICAALMGVGLTNSCGNDDDTSAAEIAGVVSYDARKNIEESNNLSFTFSEEFTTAETKFAVSNAANMRFAIVLAAVNGKRIAEFPAVYSEADNMFHVTFSNLSPGNTYFYHIVAYDADGNYVSRANEGSFTLPQLPGPDALTGLVGHSPTGYIIVIDEYNLDGSYHWHRQYDGYITGESINTGVEYSIDGGVIWYNATRNGIIENLNTGSVLVRLAATTSKPAGESVEVIIPGNADFSGEEGTAEGENARQASLTR